MKPKVFVASSSSSLDLATAVQANLDDFAEVTVWNQNKTISTFNLENLSAVLESNEFGVFVLSPDDEKVIEGKSVKVARDNVILEFGMFVGGHGLKRCFILAPDDADNVHFPLDLLGLTYATYSSAKRRDDNKESMLGPACKRIKNAIKKELSAKASTCDICRHNHILHYVPPSKSTSLFFDTFLKLFSLSLWRLHDHRLRICPPDDPYSTVVNLIKSVRENDAILFVPINMTDGKHEILSRALADHPNCRLVFADRQPPNDLIENYPNVSFIGINNRRVGVLSAFCLHDALSRSNATKAYLVVDGPGGPERSEWFKIAIQALDKSALVETVPVKDLDRFDTVKKLSKTHIDFLSEHAGCSIGVFAGNDETASSFCHQIIEKKIPKVKIVGCDATREMRQWVDNPKSSAVCTIYNKILEESAIDLIISSVEGKKVIKVLDPTSYPGSFDRKMANNPLAMELWRRAK